MALKPADFEGGARASLENADLAALRAVGPLAAPTASPALDLQNPLHDAFAEAPV